MNGKLIAALEEIERFGYENSGRGFTCARMASVALGKEPRKPEGWADHAPECDGDLPDMECIESDGFITCYFSGQVQPI